MGVLVLEDIPVGVFKARRGGGVVLGGRGAEHFFVRATEDQTGPPSLQESAEAAVEAAPVARKEHLGVDAAPL